MQFVTPRAHVSNWGSEVDASEVSMGTEGVEGMGCDENSADMAFFFHWNFLWVAGDFDRKLSRNLTT